MGGGLGNDIFSVVLMTNINEQSNQIPRTVGDINPSILCSNHLVFALDLFIGETKAMRRLEQRWEKVIKTLSSGNGMHGNLYSKLHVAEI